MADPKPSGLFSSLTLGRAARSPRSSETLAHPLLGASTSSLNLNNDSDPSSLAAHGTSPTNPTLSPKASSTFSRIHTESLPYKPRQRHTSRNSSGSIPGVLSPNILPSVNTTAPTAPPTTSTSSTFALPPSAEEMLGEPGIAGPSSASATSRLQVQSLKASAQRLGLANGSMGMAMVDAVVDKGQVAKSGSKHGEGGDWGDIMRVLTSGKAILLLPTTNSSSLPMTPQVMREHLAFISPPIYLNPLLPSQIRSSDSLAEKGREASGDTVAMVVTLSGLIGTMKGNTITFESILEPDSPLLTALRDPASRPGVLAALRPTTLSVSTSFPSYILSPQSTPLAFPPLGKPIGGLSDGKDAAKEAKASSTKMGRMNPFASFFGSSASSTAVVSASVPDETGTLMVSRFDLSPNTGSSNPSILSADVTDNASVLSEPIAKDAEGFSVQAYTVSNPIRTPEVHKALSKAIRTYVKEDLSRLPERTLERTTKLALASICPSTSGNDLLKAPAETDSIPSVNFAEPTVASEQLQDFMESIYDDLVVHFRNDSSSFVAEAGLRRKGSGGKPWGRSSLTNTETPEEDGSKEAKDKRRRDREERAEKMGSEGTERIEALITRLLYNRLFSPLESDDARHDEALASRIAALNMLDLSLDHLGLITRPDDEEKPGTIAAGLSSIVDQIGDELQKLITPTCLVPRAKAEVLIKAHKLVVDGLSDLPPVQLRPEGEQYKPSPAISHSDTVEDPPTTPDVTEESKSRPPNAASSSSSSPGPSSPLQSPITSDSHVTAPSRDEAVDSESLQLEEAMGDSVLTLHAAPSSPHSPTLADETEATPRPKPSSKQNTSGADLILPIIIFTVVKANPPQLASQLMYLRRYRSAICLTGEASYAMVNLTAVVEFLEHVDLAELGLGGESDKVMSVADLSPIGLDYLSESNEDTLSIASASSRLRGRVFQVGELAGTAAGSANKVITGVIDSSWSAVRGLISTAATGTEESGDATVAGSTRPTMRTRQASGFSLANVTASVASIAAAAAATTAAARSRAGSRAAEQPQAQQWQGNQEMIDVTSRPQSIKEADRGYPSDSETDTSDTEGSNEKSKDPFAAGSGVPQPRGLSDARSIRSVSSMMSREGRKEDAGRMAERVSLSDRLANIGGFGRVASGTQEPSPGPSPEKDHPTAKPVGFLASLTGSRSASSTGLGHGRRGSLLSGAPESIGRLRANSGSAPTPGSPSRTPSILSREEPVPKLNERFMTCDLGDIQLSELGELLREYRRLAEFVNNTHGKSPVVGGSTQK